MYWLLFSVGGFLIVRYVDDSGCLVMSGYTAAVCVLRYLIARGTIRRHYEAAANLRAQAAALTTDDAEMLGFGAGFASGVGDAFIENAQGWSDVVVGGVAKATAAAFDELAVPEAARPLIEEAARHESLADDEDTRVLFLPFGVLATSALWVALAHFDVIPTPQDDAVAAIVAQQEQDGPSEAARAREAQRAEAQRRATTSFRAAFEAYEGLPTGASLDARLASYRSLAAAEDAWRAAYDDRIAPWDPSVNVAVERLQALSASASGGTAPPSRQQRAEMQRALGAFTAAIREARARDGALHLD
jgi:hypothetical protein